MRIFSSLMCAHPQTWKKVSHPDVKIHSENMVSVLTQHSLGSARILKKKKNCSGNDQDTIFPKWLNSTNFALNWGIKGIFWIHMYPTPALQKIEVYLPWLSISLSFGNNLQKTLNDRKLNGNSCLFLKNFCLFCQSISFWIYKESQAALASRDWQVSG